MNFKIQISRRRFVEQERRLAEELGTKFRGTGSVNIAVLDFPFKKLRNEDDENTERLERLFKKQKGCRDWDVSNHIPAVIRQDQLDAALSFDVYILRHWYKRKVSECSGHDKTGHHLCTTFKFAQGRQR